MPGKIEQVQSSALTHWEQDRTSPVMCIAIIMWNFTICITEGWMGRVLCASLFQTFKTFSLLSQSQAKPEILQSA